MATGYRTGYRFWKSSQAKSHPGGYSVSIIPGMRDWLLLNPTAPAPEVGRCVPVEDVVAFLDGLAEGVLADTPQRDAPIGDWQPIKTAPRDGTVVRLRRVFQGELVAEGPGRFAHFHDNAPARSRLLDRRSTTDGTRDIEEHQARMAMVAEPRWLVEDGLFLFPEPTHWAEPA